MLKTSKQQTADSRQHKTCCILTRLLCSLQFAVCGLLFIAAPSLNAAVDIYLAPTHSATIIGGRVTYDMYVQADTDTKLEALGDIFMAYDKNCLRLVTGSVEDLAATQIKWTDSIASLDHKSGQFPVSENTGIIRLAKVSLHEKMFLTANVPVEIYRLPFEIVPSASFSMTRLYFLKALMIDDKHKNVLRNAADSFLIKQTLGRRSVGRRP
jgi:hypothetical protein